MIEGLRWLEREVVVRPAMENLEGTIKIRELCRVEKVLQYCINGQWVDVPVIRE